MFQSIDQVHSHIGMVQSIDQVHSHIYIYKACNSPENMEAWSEIGSWLIGLSVYLNFLI